ncbi:MAG TPA: hemerythrin domain-containing protein [Candidatus Limnocylindria bacterium]|nr:hemerythrin domain-containing protein [Candidatus Limnocylindria bacterium]
MTAGALAALREEHRELLPHVERLRAVADGVGRIPGVKLREEVDAAYTFLAHQLVPHAQAEDEVLYPRVGEIMGAARATATMTREHGAVVDLIAELSNLRDFAGEPDATRQDALRRVLYGLYALVRTHFAKEEEIYLPLLEDQLTSEEGADLIARMERAAARVKAAMS